MKLEIHNYAYEKLLDYVRKISDKKPTTAEIRNHQVVEYIRVDYIDTQESPPPPAHIIVSFDKLFGA